MDEARMDLAMSRIEKALARIEDAARKIPAEPQEFVRRRKAMRSAVSNALGELDLLIEKLEK